MIEVKLWRDGKNLPFPNKVPFPIEIILDAELGMSALLRREEAQQLIVDLQSLLEKLG